MERTIKGMRLSRSAMISSVGKLKDPRAKGDLMYAFVEDIRTLHSKEERDRAYANLAEIAKDEGFYPMARNLYGLAGREKEKSEMQSAITRVALGGRASLAKRVGSTAAVFLMFIGALFFVPNLTGRVIDVITSRNVNSIALGLIGYYFLNKRG